MDKQEIFRTNFDLLLAQHNLTARQLASELSFGEMTISRWRTGKGNPSRSRLAALAEYFHVPEDYFYVLHEGVTYPQDTQTTVHLDADALHLLVLYQKASKKGKQAAQLVLEIAQQP